MLATTLQLPEKISVEKINNDRSIFIFNPLEKGYGVTIGNALRRVMLSSLEGYAITAIKIPSIQHEFSTIVGVVEDLVEIILNLKQVRFKQISDQTNNKIFLAINKQEILTAHDIDQATSRFEVCNPELVICHMDESARFEMELTVEQGIGYVPADENHTHDAEKGSIAIDAIFTPIRNVTYQVEKTRVEQKTDYESLILDIQTDGSLNPLEALQQAANILIQHFNLLGKQGVIERITYSDELEENDEATLQMRKLLDTPIEQLGLSARAYNSLKTGDIKLLGDLVKLELKEIAGFRNFGKKSMEELKALLASKNLKFGMDIAPYYPKIK